MSNTAKAVIAIVIGVVIAMILAFILPDKYGTSCAIGIGVATGIIARALLGIGKKK